MLNRRFGRWAVEARSHTNTHGHRCYHCVCDCGGRGVVSGSALRSGTSRSCGCLRRELSSTRWKNHGLSGHRLFAIWRGMIGRCHNPKSQAYVGYGGRGIFVCERWQAPAAFIADMDPSFTEGMTLDRINNEAGYSPENCRWADRREQAFNRRSNTAITFDGRTQAVFEWAKEIGIPPRTLWARIKQGWSAQDALTLPVSNTMKRASLVNFEGVTATIYEHARARGLKPDAVAQRIRRKGWNLEQALNTPVASRKPR